MSGACAAVRPTARGEPLYLRYSSLSDPTAANGACSLQPRRSQTDPMGAWRRAAWKAHTALLPLLHQTDPAKPSNTCLNLQVLWLKALAGARGETDDELSYRLLPKKARVLISRPFCWLYPPWHHKAVAQRTAFIDSALRKMLADAAEADSQLHFITIGAGFDTRALRLGSEQHTWVEIDLSAVVDEKRRILRRLLKARPWLSNLAPPMLEADLSTDAGRAVVRRAAKQAPSNAHIVFICEAVLIYLSDRDSLKLLQTCARVKDSRIVFADRLARSVENREEAEVLLGSVGLTLTNWTINSVIAGEKHSNTCNDDARLIRANGGRLSNARHMGIACQQVH